MAGGVRTLLVKWLSDTSGIEKGAKKSSGALSKIGTIAAGVFSADAIEAGAQKVYEFGKQSVEAAMSEQKAQAILAQTMKNSTGAREDQIKSTEDWITKTAEATGVSKEQLYPAFETLIRTTHSASKAQAELRTAMDVSAGTGRDLGSVSLALAKANNGSVGALQRLGIKVKQMVPDTAALTRAQALQRTAMLNYSEAVKKHGASSDQAQKALLKLKDAGAKVAAAQVKQKSSTMSLDGVMKSLNKTYGGDAAKAADTTAGKMAKLGVRFQEIKVQVGNALLPALTWLADFLLTTLPHAIDVVVTWFQTHWTQIYKYIAPLVSFVKSTFTNVMQIIQGFILFAQGFIQFVENVLTGHWGKAWQGILKMAQGIWAMIEGSFRQLWNYLQHITLTALADLAKLLWLGLQALWGLIGQGVIRMITYWELLPVRLVATMVRLIWQLGGLGLQLGSSVISAIATGMSNAWGFVSGFAASIPGKILRAVGSLGRLLEGVGYDLIMGLVHGIENAWHFVTDKISSLASHLPGPIKSVLHIGSPSKVFADEIGQWIPKGIAQGITAHAGAVSTALGALPFDALSGGSRSLGRLSPLVAATAGGSAGGGGNVYQITVNVPPMANPSAVGAATVQAIKAYERSNGASWRN